jgi:1-acyl-sn-glycerol-3-phosphate acyltransferase
MVAFTRNVAINHVRVHQVSHQCWLVWSDGMTWLRSLAFNVLFLLWTSTLGLLCLPLLLFSWQWEVRLVRFWVWGTMWLLNIICGIRAEIRGLERVPAGPVIFASRHQSAWETLYWFLLFREPAFVFKKELLRIPVFGWHLAQAGQIMVDRRGGARALKDLLQRAEAVVREGRQIVIFPEGTRTQPGETRPLQRGIAALYRHCNVPVVPVTLNSGLYWGRNAFCKMPGTIMLEFLPPIAPGLNTDVFMHRLSVEFSAAAAC